MEAKANTQDLVNTLSPHQSGEKILLLGYSVTDSAQTVCRRYSFGHSGVSLFHDSPESVKTKTSRLFAA
jgi:hypothetical protein